MFIEIIAPDKQLYSGEVSLVQLPGKKSAFEILRNHAPIISTLKKGIIRLIDKDGKEHTFPVGGGVIENHNNNIIVLVSGQ
jgi:F-type H+-transporting ATPase subunit epsilon